MSFDNIVSVPGTPRYDVQGCNVTGGRSVNNWPTINSKLNFTPKELSKLFALIKTNTGAKVTVNDRGIMVFDRAVDESQLNQIIREYVTLIRICSSCKLPELNSNGECASCGFGSKAVAVAKPVVENEEKQKKTKLTTEEKRALKKLAQQARAKEEKKQASDNDE